MTVTPIHLMVVADDADARAEIAARLSAHAECAVVAAVASQDDLAAPAADADPDVLLWDLGADAEPGLARLSDASALGLPIIAMVADDQDGVRALAAGAAGLLSRAHDPERIVLAARAVLGGLFAIDPSVGAAVGAGRISDDPPAETLTRREREVLGLMAEGIGNKQIAERLRITEHTAKFHVHTILGKLGTQNRTEAVVRAARLGLVPI